MADIRKIKSTGKTILRGFDLLTIYRFIRLLTSDFEQWPAYETGVIDSDGNLLVKGNQRTPEQKNSYTMFHRLVRNMKKLISRIPFVGSKLGTFATALFLIRESQRNPFASEKMLEERFREYWKNNATFIVECYNMYTKESKILNETTTTSGIQITNKPMDFRHATDEFMGMKVFSVNTERFMKSRHGKRKHDRYERYVGNDEIGEEIRLYGRANPKKGIILRDSQTDAMIILKRPQQ